MQRLGREKLPMIRKEQRKTAMNKNLQRLIGVFRRMEKWVLAAIVLTAAISLGNRTRPEASAVSSAHSGDAAAADDRALGANGQLEHPSVEVLSHSFRTAAERVLPAIVEIKGHGGTASSCHPDATDDFRPFGSGPLFGWQPMLFGEPAEPPLPESTVGSGILIDSSGMVVTNHHVVQGMQRPVVQLADGRRFAATEVKSDPASDLAVLKIDSPTPLPAARLGDSNRLRIGDWVLALGSPLDLRQTVSAGIVSATGRRIQAAGNIRLLQTDAAINPGSSGGALVDLRGEVVGVTTAVASQDGGYQGIGLVIPSNIVLWVVDQLQKHGEVRRSTIGITTALLPPAQDGSTTSQTPRIQVTHIENGSPAEKAGLRVDDMIMAFANTNVVDRDLLEELIQRQEVGSKHRLTFLRDEKTRVVDIVTQREAPAANRVHDGLEPASDPEEIVYSRDLQIEVALHAGAETATRSVPSIKGVIIVRADPSGPGFRDGLRAGMAISQVNQQPVEDLNAFVETLEDASLEDGIELGVQTPGGRKDILVKMP